MDRRLGFGIFLMEKPSNGGSTPSGPVMKEGKIVDKFSLNGKDGKKYEIIFRYPKKTDVKAALKMINYIRSGAEYLELRRMETLKSEKKWLFGMLEEMRKRKALTLFVEVNKELVGDSAVWPFGMDASTHVAEFGIALKEEFTELGIGTRLAKKVIQLAKKETDYKIDRKSTRLNSSHIPLSRMPSSA